MDKKSKITVDDNDSRGGRAGECALYTVLEGIVGGLDYLVIGLRERGDWARVKVLRERLMDCLVVLAVDVYGSCEKGNQPHILGMRIRLIYCAFSAVCVVSE